MGKRLIIKDADFSVNAVYTIIEWTEVNSVKPPVITNPNSASVGQYNQYSTDPSSGYQIFSRTYGTVVVPAGSKILFEVLNKSTGTRMEFVPNANSYSNSWSGTPASVPESAFPASVIYYNSDRSFITQRYEWTNNTGNDVNFMFVYGLKNLPAINDSLYKIRYAIVEP